MSISRLKHISQIGVEQMGDLADSLANPAVLRFENLDTDLRLPQAALDFTKNREDFTNCKHSWDTNQQQEKTWHTPTLH